MLSEFKPNQSINYMNTHMHMAECALKIQFGRNQTSFSTVRTYVSVFEINSYLIWCAREIYARVGRG